MMKFFINNLLQICSCKDDGKNDGKNDGKDDDKKNSQKFKETIKKIILSKIEKYIYELKTNKV